MLGMDSEPIIYNIIHGRERCIKIMHIATREPLDMEETVAMVVLAAMVVMAATAVMVETGQMPFGLESVGQMAGTEQLEVMAETVVTPQIACMVKQVKAVSVEKAEVEEKPDKVFLQHTMTELQVQMVHRGEMALSFRQRRSNKRRSNI